MNADAASHIRPPSTEAARVWLRAVRLFIGGLGRFIKRIPPPIRRAFYWLAMAGETWVFLPVGALAVAVSDALPTTKRRGPARHR